MAEPLPLRAVVGPAVRRIRESAGARQEDVAVAAQSYGLTWKRSTVGDIEAGNRPLGVETLALLPAILTRITRRRVGVADLLDPHAGIAVSDSVAMTGRALADVLADRQPPPDQVVRADPTESENPRPSEADRRVARRLGITAEAAAQLAHHMLGRGFAEARDALAHEFDPLASPDRRRGLRARATTLLLARMRQELAQAALAATRNDTTEEAWT